MHKKRGEALTLVSRVSTPSPRSGTASPSPVLAPDGANETCLPRSSTMKFRPLYDRVLVKRVSSESKSAGGLIIPDTAKEKPQEAEVIAVGAGRALEDGKVRPMSLNVGDRVLFGKYTGDEIKLDGVEHIILREEDVLAVLEK
jgi:chaperonin GroES